MSTKRRDLHRARVRRDRIRREKHGQHAHESSGPPAPVVEHPFAAERALYEIQALLDGQEFESLDEANARLADLTSGGRLSERANSWKQDDPKWRAQQLAYDALETGDIVEALRLCNAAFKLDPDCTDAQRLMVSVMPMSLENRLLLMREVVEKAERSLGESFFDGRTGHFWSDVTTRPYMRAKQHLSELLTQAGRLQEAIAVCERMLELNPDDNQAMRYPLIGLYLAVGRPESANRVLSRHPDQERILGTFAWARVFERWLSGKLDEAQAALFRARGVNPYAERYLSGKRPLPEEPPAYFRPGEDTDAQVCACNLAVACKSHPEFREWLRGQR